MAVTIPTLSTFVACLVAALAIVAGHYFAWPKRLARLLAYGFGVGTIMLSFALLATLEHGGATTWASAAIVLAIVAAAAGATTLACYAFDGWWRMRNVLKAMRERNGEN